MPKRARNDEEKIKRYERKIRRWKEKCRRHIRRRSIFTESESDSESAEHDRRPKKRRGAQGDNPQEEADDNIGKENIDPSRKQVDSNDEVESQLDVEKSTEVEVEPGDPILDTEILQALGDPIQEKPKYGSKINVDLANRWNTILKNGLDRESRENLLREYLVPENCQLLQAPKLDSEIIATISDNIKNRDKKIEAEQQQLGQGITALSRALSLLVTNSSDRLNIIKILSDSSKILNDLHHLQTVSRKKLITPILDKKFLDLIKDVERDEYLYGGNLSEKIKTMKNAQKSGQTIKKADNFKTPVNRKPTNFNSPGNFNGPPRYQMPKPYNRSGPKRPITDRTPPFKQQHHPLRKSKPEMKRPARK